ncbi:MAG: potassium channel family protein [Pseudomonadota bacterium]
MLIQLLIGAGLIAASIGVQVVFTGLLAYALTLEAARVARPLGAVASALALSVAALWLMMAHGVSIWLWAGAFLALGEFSGWEEALYFSIVCFTTLGFGDIIPDESWRILSGLCAANGLLVFGVSTAFLAEMLRRLREA